MYKSKTSAVMYNMKIKSELSLNTLNMFMFKSWYFLQYEIIFLEFVSVKQTQNNNMFNFIFLAH